MKAHSWGKVYPDLWIPTLNPVEYLVLSILMQMRNEKTRIASLRNAQMIKIANMSPSCVFRSLQKIRYLGWIERKKANGELCWYVNPPETQTQAEQIRAQRDGDV